MIVKLVGLHSLVTFYTGCPTKNYALFWRAVAPLNYELGIKVGGVMESSGSQLLNAYNSFSVAFKTPEIFEFKVD